MGNCLASAAAATAATDGDIRVDTRPRAKIPREEQLGLIPTRVVSNDGRCPSASVFTQQGRKGVNQDAFLLWEEFGGVEGSVLCGVFDGHGPYGHLVARKVRDALPLKLLAAVARPRDRRQRASPGIEGLPLDDWRKVFDKAYKAMDRDLAALPSLDCFCSGSTAVTVLKMGSNLYMGNIGDSRAVLGSMNDAGTAMVALQLTVDLKPDLPTEAERIKKCRGRVFALQDEPEVLRVWLPFDDAPGLAMARAFGDFCLKDYGVISAPEFFHWSLTDKDQFVILASDGIWDVLSNQEAVDIVSSSPSRQAAARSLIEAASREWKTKFPTSKIDDCAVVCLYLDGEVHADCDNGDANSVNMDNCSVGSPATETNDAQEQEPSLTRNFTVRSCSGSARNLQMACEEQEGMANRGPEEQNWAGPEAVTRVNSLVHLPRFSDDKKPDS